MFKICNYFLDVLVFLLLICKGFRTLKFVVFFVVFVCVGSGGLVWG